MSASDLKYPVESFVEEADFEAEDFNELVDAKQLTCNIHMPQLTQLDESKISFDTASLANNSIVVTNRRKPKKTEQEQQQQQQPTPIKEAITPKLFLSEIPPAAEREEKTVKHMALTKPATGDPAPIKGNANSYINFNKENNNNSSLWQDNSVAVKSHTQFENTNDKVNASKVNNKEAGSYGSSQIDFQFTSPSSYFQSQPVTNGGYTYRINPTIKAEFSYLNRNKLVNRRIAIKKQGHYSAGLPSLGSSSDHSLAGKVKSEFALGSEKMLNDLKELDQIQVQDIALSEHHQTPDPFGYYKNMASNVMRKTQPKSGKLRKKSSGLVNKNKPKTTPIIILEREKSAMVDETPSPASYHIPRRPQNEKNAPTFTMGKRCFIEKGGGGRVSWEKEWFNSRNPYTHKSDFRRELFWPSPTNYRIKSTIGTDPNASSKTAPAYSYPSQPGSKHNSAKHPNTADTPMNNSSTPPAPLNTRENLGGCKHTQNIVLSRDDLIEKDIKKYNVIKDLNFGHSRSQGHSELNVIKSSHFVSSSAPKIGFKFRERGTELWGTTEKTPGPGAYDHTKFYNTSKFNKTTKFSVPQAKHSLNFSVGPYATL